VTLAGVSSAPFYITIDTPLGLEVATDEISGQSWIVDLPYTANNSVGFQTLIKYHIRSGCGFILSPIRVNEYFTQNTRSTALFNGSINNWQFVLNNPPPGAGYTGNWDVTAFDNLSDPGSPDWVFTDTLTQAESPPFTLNPTPQYPSPDPTALGGYRGTSTAWTTWQLQTFRLGSLTQGIGYMVQLGDLTFYLDHARVLPSPPQ
jgi:hypothetical protein